MTATMDNGGSFEIGDDLMTAGNSEHRAYCPEGQQWAKTWQLSWLPDRMFDRNQAISGMLFTVAVAAGCTTPEHREWPFLRSLAGELDVDVEQAVAAVLAPADTVPGTQTISRREKCPACGAAIDDHSTNQAVACLRKFPGHL